VLPLDIHIAVALSHIIQVRCEAQHEDSHESLNHDPGGSGSVSMRMSDKLQFVVGNDKLKKLIGHQTDLLPPGGTAVNLEQVIIYSSACAIGWGGWVGPVASPMESMSPAS
jgi:hypothetical protein